MSQVEKLESIREKLDKKKLKGDLEKFDDGLGKKLGVAQLLKEAIKKARTTFNEAQNKLVECEKKYIEMQESLPSEVTVSFDEYREKQEKLEVAIAAEIESSRELLLNECALVSRIKRTWGDRASIEKLTFVLKEMFVFNTQYLETYSLSFAGSDEVSDGIHKGVGGNGGKYTIPSTGISCINEGGKAAKSTTLHGTYVHEYDFAYLKGIQEVQELETGSSSPLGLLASPIAGTGSEIIRQAALKVAVTGVTDAVKVAGLQAIQAGAVEGAKMAALQGAKVMAMPIVGLGLGIGMVLAQCIVSPLIANASCEWVDGPYRITTKTDKDGTQGEEKIIDTAGMAKQVRIGFGILQKKAEEAKEKAATDVGATFEDNPNGWVLENWEDFLPPILLGGEAYSEL